MTGLALQDLWVRCVPSSWGRALSCPELKGRCHHSESQPGSGPDAATLLVLC